MLCDICYSTNSNVIPRISVFIGHSADWTYLVNCGRGAKPQVIHVDRMRRYTPQKLFGEIEQKAQPSADEDINKEKYEVIDGVFDPESGAYVRVFE
jgi:transcription antitermination factor NusG